MPKYELITAQEARRQIDQMETEEGAKEKATAAAAIQAAVQAGRSEVNLSPVYRQVAPLKAWLESLGYKVSSGSDQRDGNWFQVKW